MQLRADQIKEHVQHPLQAVYLISGEEPLQLMETADAITAAAVQQGFNEHTILHVDPQFDWQQLLAESSSLSLFAERKLLDVRLSSAKIGQQGSKALQAWMDAPPGDKILLIRCEKMDKSARQAAWVKRIAKSGVVIHVWNLSNAQTRAWVAKRMQQANLKPEAGVVDYLTERVEGNLLAAAQEINKLALLHEGALSLEQLVAAISDHARFSVFDLSEAILARDYERLTHMVEVLRQEGTPVPLIIWAYSDLLRQLNLAAGQLQQGQSISQQILVRMPKARQALFQRAAGAMQNIQWNGLFMRLALLDQHSKGVGADVSRSEQRLWDEILEIGLLLSGKRLFKH